MLGITSKPFSGSGVAPLVHYTAHQHTSPERLGSWAQRTAHLSGKLAMSFDLQPGRVLRCWNSLTLLIEEYREEAKPEASPWRAPAGGGARVLIARCTCH
jgi:hypothetical protein